MNNKNIYIESSRAPLPYLLVNSDLHVTFFSSSVYEAKYCNTPSVIVDKRGQDYFSHLVDDGSAYFALNKIELNRIIETIQKKDGSK